MKRFRLVLIYSIIFSALFFCAGFNNSASAATTDDSITEAIGSESTTYSENPSDSEKASEDAVVTSNVEDSSIPASAEKNSLERSASPKERFVTEEGHTYYYKNGVKQSGVIEDNGSFYYLDLNTFALLNKVSIVEFDENRYFVLESGKIVVSDWVYWNDKKAYANDRGIIAKGTYYVGPNKYTTDADGFVIEPVRAGFVVYDDGMAYRMTNGAYAKGLFYVGKDRYYADENGKIEKKARWIDYNGKRYFSQPNGALYRSRWLYFGDKKAYVGVDGAAGIGTYYVGTTKYTSDEEGYVIEPGFVNVAGGMAYRMTNGAYAKGLFYVGQDRYYADEHGKIEKKARWIDYNGKRYFSQPNGALYRSRWLYFGDKSAYASGDGSIAIGNYYIGSTLYVSDDEGFIELGPKIVSRDGKTFFINKDGGITRNGWVKVNDTQYAYAKADGDFAKGFYYIGISLYYGNPANGFIDMGEAVRTYGDIKVATKADGSLHRDGFIMMDSGIYYAKSSGLLAVNETVVVDGLSFKLEADGRLKAGSGIVIIGNDKYFRDSETGGVLKNRWIKFGDDYYYAGVDGKFLSGWQTIGGETYYFATDTKKMAKNTYVGRIYMDASGQMAGVYKYAYSLAKSLDFSLRNCYNWVISNMSYSGYNLTSSTTVEDLAAEGLYYKNGNCYVFAATFYAMAAAMGYDARVMKGYVQTLSHGNQAHGWCEVRVNGVTYICDPENEWYTHTDQFMKQYRSPGTSRYVNYGPMN